jgi:hypothetical protein
MKEHHKKLIQLIREEFEETPGLRLTASEASRFWALDPATCELALTELALQGFLSQGLDDRFQAYEQA